MKNKFIKKIDKIFHKIKYKIYGIDVRGNVPYKRNEFISKGENNKLIAVIEGKKIEINSFNFKKYFKSAQILMIGNNNLIKIHFPTQIIETKIVTSGNNNVIELNKTKYKYDLSIIRAMRGSKIFIKENFSVACNMDICIAGKNSSLNIGNDCMFSSGISIFNQDGHQILDENGNIINKSNDIIIGNHVWLGKNITVFNKAAIPDNTIVGVSSLVNKHFINPHQNNNLPIGIVLAGNPAKIVKERVYWIRDAIN